jgi:hypothetical protein
LLKAVAVALVALAAALVPTTAHAQIRQPGAHPDYVVDLEPHLVWQYAATEDFSDGLGLGLRASIPVLRNGPVTTINNNFAIGFGLDWTHFSEDCGRATVIIGNVRVGSNVGNCYANHFIIPIVAQWNFFFTPVIGAFAELGLGIHHWDEEFTCNGAAVTVGGAVVACNASASDHDTEVIPMFGMGPRFILSDLFAITIRVGYPYLTIGGSFLL